MSFCKFRKIPSLSGAEDELQGAQAPLRATYLLAAPGSPLGPSESVFDPTLACYFPFVAEIFAIYLPGSSRHRISRFRVFSFSVYFCQENFQQNLGAMASPSSPKDKYIVNVINPYLAEVRKHPQ